MEKQEKNKNIFYMRKEQVFALIFSLFLILLGFLVGYSINKNTELKDYKVYVDKEEQFFRDAKGMRVYPIQIGNQVYIPVSGTGSFLDYMTIKEQNSSELYLYNTVTGAETKIIKGFISETLDGDTIDDSIFKDSDYTIFMVWATWCPDCDKELVELKEINDYLKNKNVQIISVPTDLPRFVNKSEITDELKNKIYQMTEGIDIREHIYIDEVLNNRLIGNSTFIPTLLIFDEYGNLVKKIDYEVSSEQLIEIFDNITK